MSQEEDASGQTISETRPIGPPLSLDPGVRAPHSLTPCDICRILRKLVANLSTKGATHGGSYQADQESERQGALRRVVLAMGGDRQRPRLLRLYGGDPTESCEQSC